MQYFKVFHKDNHQQSCLMTANLSYLKTLNYFLQKNYISCQGYLRWKARPN